MFGSRFANKCKHAIKCVKSRLDPIRKKKQAMLRFLKKDVADLLANGHDNNAFGRIEALIIEINQASCYDMIEQFCECILKQLSSLQKQRECPQEATEAVSTIIFAAARFPDLPELCDLRHVFTDRYGNNMESFVNAEFIEKIQKKSFSKEKKLQMMQNIADELSVRFDHKALELKLSNPPGTKPDQPKIGTSFTKDKRPSSMLPTGCKDDSRKGQGQLEPRDNHVISNDDQVQKTRKITANELKNMAPLNIQSKYSHKEIKKDYQLKDGQAHNRTLNVQERPDPIDQEEQEICPKKPLETKSSKTLPTYTKYTAAENREHIEKNGFVHNRSEMDEDDRDSDRKSKARLGYFRIEKQGVGSAKSSSDKTIDMVPPYTKIKGTNIGNFVEEDENSFSYERLSSAPELEPSVQDQPPARPVNHEKAVNWAPPYVKSNVSTESAHVDQASQSSAGDDRPTGIKDKYTLKVRDERPTPASVRRKFAKPPVIDSNYKAVDNEKLVSGNPSGGRRHAGRLSSAINADNSDGKVVDHYPHPTNGEVDTAPDHGKLSNRAPSGHRGTTSRWNSTTSDDHCDGRTRDNEEDNAIDYGMLFNRTSNGQRRRGNKTSTYDGECDEEERVMNELLVHYSKKSSTNEHAKTRTRTRPRQPDHIAEHCGIAEYDNNSKLLSHPKDSLHPCERAASLPAEPVRPAEVGKGHARATSLQPDLLALNRDRVHPRLPDYDELAARINALTKA
ncbi:uncharacterized protein [Typha angustifolia]|uniref:uncharacterized protein n=1 Tax=Typha angustifolia TaxID=59011 RepID=UPI003C2FBCA5